MADSAFTWYVVAQAHVDWVAGRDGPQKLLFRDDYEEWGQVAQFLAKPFASGKGLTDEGIAKVLHEFSHNGAVCVEFQSPSLTGAVFKMPTGFEPVSVRNLENREKPDVHGLPPPAAG